MLNLTKTENNSLICRQISVRVCIVEGRGAYKKTVKFCPILEQTSNVECVIGIDRLDCLRRIHKGSAHFGVFSSEDLVAARFAGIEVNEIDFLLLNIFIHCAIFYCRF